MIRVRKPDPAPRILLERGAALTAELCARVEAGERPSFEREVYGAAEVKEVLRAAQHDKCCFCEAKLGHAQFGDVEHFRPKASVQQSSVDPPTPGYYWLAYAWQNLYLSCEICNRRHKQKLFPRRSRGTRAPRRCTSCEICNRRHKQKLFPLANPDRRVSSHHRKSSSRSPVLTQGV